MTTSQQTLILLSGSIVVLNTVQAALLPEVVTLESGSIITLENDKQEYLGTAEITDVKVETFALLQQKDLELTTHEETTSWPNALATLAEQAPGFSQLDKVSIVTFYVTAVAGSGLVINAATAVEAPAPVEPPAPEPSVAEQFSALDTVAQLGTDVEGNHV